MLGWIDYFQKVLIKPICQEGLEYLADGRKNCYQPIILYVRGIAMLVKWNNLAIFNCLGETPLSGAMLKRGSKTPAGEQGRCGILRGYVINTSIWCPGAKICLQPLL